MKSGLSRMAVMAGVGLGMASLGAQAAVDWTWTLNASPSGTSLPGTTAVMGYSAPNNSTNLVATSGSGLPDMTWYSGGYGICSPTPGDPNCADPNHTVDNNTAYESVLLSFQKKVTLSSVSIGYYSGDSDISVLAYTGSGSPTPLTSSTYGSLLGSGWSLVGQYANLHGTGMSATLGTSLSSSYWLVAAYNSAFGNMGWTSGNDYVKLYAVAGNTVPDSGGGGKVPEPAALLLVGTGLLGMAVLRRRQMGRAG